MKCSLYRPGVAQRVGRGIALLFHDRGSTSGWVVSSTPRPHFTPGKEAVPILQEAGLALGPVWTGGKSRHHRDSIPDSPTRSQSLYRLSYWAHRRQNVIKNVCQRLWIPYVWGNSSRNSWCLIIVYLTTQRLFVFNLTHACVLWHVYKKWTYVILTVWRLTTHIWVVPHR